MVKRLVPIADISNAGVWTTEPLWSTLAENPPFSFITSSELTTSKAFRVQLEAGVYNSGNDHEIVVKIRARMDPTQTLKVGAFVAKLAQGSDSPLYTSSSITVGTSTFNDFHLKISDTDVDQFDDFSALEVEVSASGGANAKMQIETVEVYILGDPQDIVSRPIGDPNVTRGNRLGLNFDSLFIHSTIATDWNLLNEDVAEDTSLIEIASGGIARPFWMEEMETPANTDPVSINVRYKNDSGTTAESTVTMKIGGATAISRNLPISTVWTTKKFNLTPTEIDNALFLTFPITVQVEDNWWDTKLTLDNTDPAEAISISQMFIQITEQDTGCFGDNFDDNFDVCPGVIIKGTHPTADLRGLGLDKPRKPKITTYLLTADGKITRIRPIKARGKLSRFFNHIVKSKISRKISITARGKATRIHINNATSKIFTRDESKQGYKEHEKVVDALDSFKEVHKKHRVSKLSKLFGKYRKANDDF